MDIDSLRAFISVVETGSFSLAAKKLYVTQPAISKRIASLENHLNHTLFDRMARDTERSIRELSGEIHGSLKVATSHHIGLHHLPPILREFASLHRNVNLQFEFLDSEQAHEKIIRGDCELAIVTISPKLEHPLKAEVIWQDPLAFVCGKNHDLAGSPQTTLQALSQSPAILPDLNTFTGKMIKRCFDQAELPLTLNMATNYLETIKMMASVGLGWSVLPLSMLDDQLIQLEVSHKKNAVYLTRNLGVITHKHRTLGNAARAFYATLCGKDNTDT